MKRNTTIAIAILQLIAFSAFAQIVRPKKPVVNAETPFLAEFDPGKFDADSIDLYRRGVERRILSKGMQDAVYEFQADVNKEFALVDALLATDSSVLTFMRYQGFTDKLNFQKLGVSVTPGSIAIRYNTVSFYECENTAVDIDISEFRNVRRLQQNGTLLIYVTEMVRSCGQIEPFPTEEITKEYSDYLHQQISKVLSVYPKLNTNIAQYDKLEKSRSLATLRDTVEFRGKFLKYCLAKI